ALLVLTVVTVGVSLVDLGPLSTVVALAIAAAKASLVILFFMHVRYGPRLIWIFASGGFFWLALLILLTMSDIVSRGWHIIPGR
ncbi:MAG TPA: cytochrome C oxidase subunit IV family protein, partial [Candidatus Binatus sp.]|nr:cytochrome C oxidase subunit IV family protein [Candidatus Binatus sp.]